MRDSPAPGTFPGVPSTTLRLPVREPCDLGPLLEFFGRRAVAGIEAFAGDTYRRAFVHEGVAGWFELYPDTSAGVELAVHHPAAGAKAAVAARVSRMFDLDADAAAIARSFLADPLLGPLQARWPGQRVPGAFDGFEMAVRAVLGQQVSVAAARTLASRIVARHGTSVALACAPAVGMLFPPPAALVDAALEREGVMRARAQTIRTLSAAVLEGRVGFAPGQSLEDFERSLLALPGIGPWTAQYLAMRALGHRDAFPAADLVLRRVAGQGRALPAAELERMAEAWRPWRAHAVMLLWRAA
ncbi:MAG: DNA-3-methyladenine glycosylase 2 family protein [Xanthomonadales bacterium]|nr:DNA-3-methyladenine glycosylase 2 family protein [Xanthomonadales bacterium]